MVAIIVLFSLCALGALGLFGYEIYLSRRDKRKLNFWQTLLYLFCAATLILGVINKANTIYNWEKATNTSFALLEYVVNLDTSTDDSTSVYYYVNKNLQNGRPLSDIIMDYGLTEDAAKTAIARNLK